MRSCPQCANLCDASHRFCPSCGFPIAEVGDRGAQDDPFINRTLPGGYVILDLVGIGGMGRVYRAEQKTLGRTVAVKVIHPHLLGDESAAARFITEARAASRLNHPNSVAVIDFGKTDDGQLYLVMEFLRGRDLSRIDYEEGPLPIRRVINVLVQTLAALAEAHHLGIIHRDLKPENIILEPLRSGGDFVKVVDFGLAKMREGARDHAITTPGIICGTPDYMAPEQGRGAPIDARTDLYAVGVILFQLLTGRLPFEADSPTQVVLMHLSIPPPDPRQVAPDRSIPEVLVNIVARALSKEPDDRYPSSEAFSEVLAQAQAELESASRGSIISLQMPCPTCNAQIPRGQKFCGECGARISVPPGMSRAPAPPAFSAAPPSMRPSGARLPLPLTGREEDLAWLEGCAKGVRSSVCAARIIGDAGVGKTRLIGEFVSAARARGDWVVEAGPDPWWADVGYYTLRRTICLLARLESGGGSERDWTGASSEARQGLSEIFGRAPGAASSLSPTERRYTAAEGLRWAIGRASALAGRNRVIVVVDDLHRVDGASRNALADTLSEPPLVPMLLLASHGLGFDPRWSGQEESRSLSGLPTALAAQLTKGLPLASSGGDSGAHARGAVLPMYLDQLARFALERGSDPPSRLADLISLRIERLGPAARRVLQALAVLGDEVGLKEIESLVQKDANDGKPRRDTNGSGTEMAKEIAASLDELIQANMIQETPSGYSHTHPLLREIAGATIPAAVRRDLHARAAQNADERELPLEIRAMHTLYAQDSFEALLLLERVAERALGRADTWGAIRALHNGLELARRELFRGEIDDPMRAVLIFSRKLGEALTQAGDLTDADGVLREALDLAGPAGQDRARVLRALANVAHGRARSREALGYLKEALEHAARSGAQDLVASLEDMRRTWAS